MGSTYFGTALTDGETADILDAFIEIGGNCIDTARVYGDFERRIEGISEAAIGRWLKGRQDVDRLVINTKGGHPPLDDMHRGRLDRENLTRDLNQSLEALGIGTVDIYWLHRDDESRPVGDILATLNEFIESGLIRAAGASNWSPERIREANQYANEHGLCGFCANQPQWSLARMRGVEDPTLREMDRATYRMHAEDALLCMPYSSQAKGFFTKLDALGEDALPDKARRRFLTEHNLNLYQRLLKVRMETGLSVGAQALAYLTGQPFPVIPIVGVSRLAQVEALKEAGEAQLPADDLAQLTHLNGLI